jgi:Tfp pilus assembly protein PilO
MEQNNIPSSVKLTDRITLPIALVLAICAALAIVCLAYWMYWTDDNRKYDIARAGQQTTNRITEDETAAVDVTSPVTASEISKKLKFMKQELTALEKIDAFEPEDLNDRTIQLTSPTE